MKKKQDTTVTMGANIRSNGSLVIGILHGNQVPVEAREESGKASIAYAINFRKKKIER